MHSSLVRSVSYGLPIIFLSIPALYSMDTSSIVTSRQHEYSNRFTEIKRGEKGGYLFVVRGEPVYVSDLECKQVLMLMHIDSLPDDIRRTIVLLLLGDSLPSMVEVWNFSPPSFQLSKALVPRESAHSETLNQGTKALLDWSPDGKTFLSWSHGKTAYIWDAITEACLHKLKRHTALVTSATFSPDSMRVLTGSRDTLAYIWDAITGDCLYKLEGHRASITSVAWSPNDDTCITASKDGMARLWSVKTGKCLYKLEGHTASITSVVYSPKGDTVITGSEDGMARLWSVKTGKCLYKLEGHTASITSVAYSPRGDTVTTGSEDGTARLWSVKTGKCLYKLEGHTASITSVAYSPRGDIVITGSEDGAARLWDSETGKCLHQLEAHVGPITLVVFSPDGSTVITASKDCTAFIWDVKRGHILQILAGHTAFITSVAYSPDGTKILIGLDCSAACIYDLASRASQWILNKSTIYQACSIFNKSAFEYESFRSMPVYVQKYLEVLYQVTSKREVSPEIPALRFSSNYLSRSRILKQIQLLKKSFRKNPTIQEPLPRK